MGFPVPTTYGSTPSAHYPECQPYRGVKPRRMPGLSGKLNQEIHFHLLSHRNVPAECFDAASSLPNPYPFLSDAQDFGQLRIRTENVGGDSLLQTVRAEAAVHGIGARRTTAELSFGIKVLTGSPHDRFYRLSELLPQGHEQRLLTFAVRKPAATLVPLFIEERKGS
jgi:hypothetical protein